MTITTSFQLQKERKKHESGIKAAILSSTLFEYNILCKNQNNGSKIIVKRISTEKNQHDYNDFISVKKKEKK